MQAMESDTDTKPQAVQSCASNSSSRRLKTTQTLNGYAEVETFRSPESLRMKRKRKDKKEPPKSVKPRKYYAPPEVYAHLQHLNDCLAEYLDIMFCGINPGKRSAEVGHHFAHPTNHFYRCLHASGLTDRIIAAVDDSKLPSLYSIGLTDLVDRPSSGQAELSNKEMIDGVPIFLQKITKYKPRIVCFVGKKICHTIFEKAVDFLTEPTNSSVGSSKKQRPTNDVNCSNDSQGDKSSKERLDEGLGLRPYKLIHEPASVIHETLFFCSVSTSAAVSTHQLADKVAIFEKLHDVLLSVKKGSIDTSKMQIISVQSTDLKVHSHNIGDNSKTIKIHSICNKE